MSDNFIYLLKVSAGLGIIILPYYFLFRNDPNLLIKRVYLLLGLLSAWLIPLMVFRRPEVFVNLTPIVFIDPLGAAHPPVSFSETGTKSGLTINWLQLLFISYVTGLIAMFLKNLFVILKWNLRWQKNKDQDGIAYTSSDQVFTLFSKIFIPRSLKDTRDLENVLLHEKAHIQQLHFIDLMIMELTLLLTWFNPFSWLISRMIKENHEHLADRHVLSTGINPARYRAQLLNHTLGVNVFRLGNQFNHSLTLKRFNMMKKPEKSLSGIIKIALLVPAVLITLGLTTGMTPQEKTIKGKVVIAETGEPAPGASIIIKGTTSGTVSDLNGEFRLIVEGNPWVVVSYVGYASIQLKASEVGNNPLQLKPQTYTMDLESVPLKVIQEDEGDISIRVSSDADKQPVYVVDGKVVQEIEHMDPDQIAKIDVIKDPESRIAKKYNAQYGVILVTSKEAGKQDPKKENKSIENEDQVFLIVEDMPSFPGGKAALKTYIYSKLEYPESAKEKGLSGEVKVQFNVKTSGELEKISAVSSTHKEFEAPAKKVFEDMPNWSPGTQRGKPVKVRVIVPVVFNADTE